MKNFLFLLVLLISHHLYSQKKVIEFENLSEFKYSLEPKISNDGVYSTIIYKNNELTKLYLFNNNKSKAIYILDGVSKSDFTMDNKYLICSKGDSIMIINLKTNNINYITDAKYVKLQDHSSGAKIVYKHYNDLEHFTLTDITTSKSIDFKTKTDPTFSPDGKSFIYRSLIGTKYGVFLHLLNSDAKIPIILTNQGDSAIEMTGMKFSYSNDSKKIAIIAENNKNKSASIWCYDIMKDSTYTLLNSTNQLPDNTIATSIKPIFTNDARKLLFTIEDTLINSTNSSNSNVDVWTYHDTILRTQYTGQLNAFKAIIDLETKQVIRLAKLGEVATLPPKSTDQKVAFSQRIHLGDRNESNWNANTELAYTLVSTENGSRTTILSGIKSLYRAAGISPTGKWLIYYNPNDNCYYSINTITLTQTCITKNINTNWVDPDNDNPDTTLNWYPSTNSWLNNDTAVLINDQFDIWSIDPSARRKPINITNGYGRKYNIKFISAISDEDLQNIKRFNNKIILAAFDNLTKKNGFFTAQLNKEKDPTLLIMSDHLYYWPIIYNARTKPIKSKLSENWLVIRMSAKESPNVFITSDLKRYKPLTNINPQKNYNWLTTKLIQWKTFDGKPQFGILYQPENLDSTKKYPIIIHFYEKLSYRLNEYLYPEPTDGSINIPWFVNRGYLVFTPDISYKLGMPGESAFNSVLSAVNHLSTINFVDTFNIGVQGHSFGGYQVNYLLTRTNKFKAAINAAGSTDLISGYNSISHGGRSRTWIYERSQYRMVLTPWESLNTYLANSPIIKANLVKTPVLIMHNKNDGQVPWHEGLEWYLALRRLGKKVWMLQYKNSGHSLNDVDSIDFTKRITQFFDYYLKGYILPKWM